MPQASISWNARSRDSLAATIVFPDGRTTFAIVTEASSGSFYLSGVSVVGISSSVDRIFITLSTISNFVESSLKVFMEESSSV